MEEVLVRTSTSIITADEQSCFSSNFLVGVAGILELLQQLTTVGEVSQELFAGASPAAASSFHQTIEAECPADVTHALQSASRRYKPLQTTELWS